MSEKNEKLWEERLTAYYSFHQKKIYIYIFPVRKEISKRFKKLMVSESWSTLDNKTEDEGKEDKKTVNK